MNEKKEEELTSQEKQVLELMRKVDFGEIRIIINNGKPVRVEEVKKSILIS